MEELAAALKETLRILENGSWHSIYSIHETYRLMPDIILESISYLRERDVIEVDERKIRLNPNMSKESLFQVIKIYRSSEFSMSEDDRFIPKDRLEMNALYLPNFDLLSDELR